MSISMFDHVCLLYCRWFCWGAKAWMYCGNVYQKIHRVGIVAAPKEVWRNHNISKHFKGKTGVAELLIASIESMPLVFGFAAILHYCRVTLLNAVFFPLALEPGCGFYAPVLVNIRFGYQRIESSTTSKHIKTNGVCNFPSPPLERRLTHTSTNTSKSEPLPQKLDIIMQYAINSHVVLGMEAHMFQTYNTSSHLESRYKNYEVKQLHHQI